MTFTKKLISAQITMGGQQLNLSGLRMTLEMNSVPAGGQGTAELHLYVYGMPLSQMNQLATVGTRWVAVQGKNKINVQAGDENGMSDIMTDGTIIYATVDGMAMPQVRFIITASGTAYAARKPIKPTTRKGDVQAEDIFGQLAKQMGLRYENGGVKCTLRNPYLWGTAISQVRDLAEASKALWFVHNGVLATWPASGHRDASGGIPLISRKTGLVGYPWFDQATMGFRTLFRPDVGRVETGRQVEMQCSLAGANGVWTVGQISTTLDSKMPRGRWFQDVQCTRVEVSSGYG